ncbi:MAG: hypothetical protein JWN89_652 [Parcubacteria group bacterium]|nr:hypothetical protein [Parcubacteria group bacterium]
MIKWNDITWYSITISGVFFLILLPSIIFYIGNQYKEVANTYSAAQQILIEAQEKVAQRAASTTPGR